MRPLSNVIRFPSTDECISREEAEVVETILYFYTQQDIRASQCELTSKSLAQIRAEQEEQESRGHAFACPVSRFAVSGANELPVGQLIVIDLGRLRAFYFHAIQPSPVG